MPALETTTLSPAEPKSETLRKQLFIATVGELLGYTGSVYLGFQSLTDSDLPPEKRLPLVGMAIIVLIITRVLRGTRQSLEQLALPALQEKPQINQQ